MTEKEMTIEEALELAVKILISHAKNLSDMPYNNLSDSVRKYQKAAAVLRQIGKPVERSVETYDRDMNPVIKRWTETPVLKRVIKTSKPVYEPVDTQNEGGCDD